MSRKRKATNPSHPDSKFNQSYTNARNGPDEAAITAHYKSLEETRDFPDDPTHTSEASTT